MTPEYFISDREITTTATASFKHFVKVDIKEDEDGRFVGTCPEIEGVVTDGKDLNECLKNLTLAIEAIKEAAYRKDAMDRSLKELLPMFENWDDKMNRHDFRPFVCANCGFAVTKFEDWTRGETLCMKCFNHNRTK